MWRIRILCALMAALTACEADETFVLLPDNGGDGSISVSGGGVSKTVGSPWSALDVGRSGSAPRTAIGLSQAALARRFSAALEHQPLPPRLQILYFEAGTVMLSETSRARLGDLVLAILDRPQADVSVIGHADGAGDPTFNLELSWRRAEAVRDALVHMGVDPDIIEVDSHGENNPLHATADNVPEPRNRRVEVIVR